MKTEFTERRPKMEQNEAEEDECVIIAEKRKLPMPTVDQQIRRESINSQSIKMERPAEPEEKTNLAKRRRRHGPEQRKEKDVKIEEEEDISVIIDQCQQSQSDQRLQKAPTISSIGRSFLPLTLTRNELLELESKCPFMELKAILIGFLVRVKVKGRPLIDSIKLVEEKTQIQGIQFERRLFLQSAGVFDFNAISKKRATENEIFLWMADVQNQGGTLPSPDQFRAKLAYVGQLIGHPPPPTTRGGCPPPADVHGQLMMCSSSSLANPPPVTVHPTELSNNHPQHQTQMAVAGTPLEQPRLSRRQQIGCSSSLLLSSTSSAPKISKGPLERIDLDGIAMSCQRNDIEKIDKLVHRKELMLKVLLPFEKVLTILQNPILKCIIDEFNNTFNGCLTACRSVENGEVFIGEILRITAEDVFFSHRNGFKISSLEPLSLDEVTDEMFSNWVDDMARWNLPLPGIRRKKRKMKSVISVVANQCRKILYVDASTQIPILYSTQFRMLVRLEPDEFAQLMIGHFVYFNMPTKKKEEGRAKGPRLVAQVRKVTFTKNLYKVYDMTLNMILHVCPVPGSKPCISIRIPPTHRRPNKKSLINNCLTLMQKQGISVPSKEMLAQKTEELQLALQKAAKIVKAD